MKVPDRVNQMRLGGLSYASTIMADPQFSQRIDSIHHAAQTLSKNRKNISHALHNVIGLLEGSERKAVISLRRELYNGNYVSAAARFDQLISATQTALVHSVGPYMKVAEAFAADYSQVKYSFPGALRSERQKLSEIAKDQRFMAGLAISAPRLVPAVTRLTTHIETGSVDKKDRKAERSLHSYVLRAATKTSPFSTLGPVAIMAAEQAEAPAMKRVSRASVYPITRVLNQLLQRPHALGELEVRVSPYAREVDGFVTIDRTTWDFKDTDTRTDFAACDETTVTIGQKPLTDAITALLNDGSDTLGSLAEDLADGSGMALQRTYELLGDMIRLGFLDVPVLSMHPQDAGRLGEITESVGKVDAQLGSLIAAYVESAEDFSNIDDPEDRAAELVRISNLVSDIYRRAGVDGDLPRSAVYEDFIVNREPADRSFDDDIADSTFQNLLALLDLLDDSNVKHALMVGYFHSLHEASVSADQFISGFIDELYDSFEGYDLTVVEDQDLPQDPWLRWGDAWEWVLARRTLSASFLQHAATFELGKAPGSALPGEYVEISDMLHNAAAHVNRPNPRFKHANVLVQAVPGSTQWMLNDAFGGIGFSMSRFTHALEEDSIAYTSDVVARAASCGVKLAELSGGAIFSNLNLHAPILPAAITIPGEPVRDGAVERTALDELDVAYSESEGRLVLVHEKWQVHPVYAGYLVPAATPRKSQVLSLFTPSSQFSRKLPDMISPKPEPGEVSVVPRFVLDNLVLARARAIVRVEDMPTKNPLEAENYLTWLRFWALNGLPARCFVRIIDDSTRAKKPNYFDIRQIVSCSSLVNDLNDVTGEAYLEIAEVLPEHPVDEYNDQHVITEHMLGFSWTEV